MINAENRTTEKNKGLTLEMLESAKIKNEIVSIYTNRDDTAHFTAGRILAVTDDDIVMSLYSRYGRFDGYILRKSEPFIRAHRPAQISYLLHLTSDLV